MPLVRCEVRNEYGLGQPQLYREFNDDDPKAVLDGVAVAGLVGILRQLGDLAEFAAEVFHGIQEQVLITANRSHKLIARVQNIEAKLPPLEKVVLAQTSHIHFAYTAGSRWHARIRENNNLFIYNDLPWFIMKSYEVCRDPPRLHLLDRFDSGGPGSCIKRYSDPTFFRRTSDKSNEFGAEKNQKVEKSHRAKKKRSSRRTEASVYTSASVSSQSGRIHFTPKIVNGHASPSHTASTTHRSSRGTEASAHSESLSNHSNRIRSNPSTVNEQASTSLTASTADMTIKSDNGDCSCSFDSRTRSSFIEYSLGSSETPELEQSNGSSSFVHHQDILNSGSLDRQIEVANYFPQKSSPDQIATSSSSVTWDEKIEVVEWWYTQQSDEDEDPEILITNSDIDKQRTKTDNGENVDKEKVLFTGENNPKSSTSDGFESEPDNYVDALNCIESESESDLDCQMKHEVEKLASCLDEEGVQGELNKETVHVDEVLLKTESMALHGLFRENELTSDIVDSIFSDYAVHAKTSGNAVTYSIPDHSPGFEGSKSSDAIDNSNTELPVSCAVESDSENDHNCQMKHEVEKLAFCVDKEGVQEELNEAMMHVADEVPLKAESIAAHDLYTENELTSDLLNPIFLNYAVRVETSDSAVTYSIPDHSPGFGGSKSSDAIDNSKAEFTVRNSVESESEYDLDCQMKHEVEKLALCVDNEGVQEVFNEAPMHVADEVSLKTESSSVHDLFTEIEHTSDLINPVFLNCAVQVETSANAEANLMPDHSPGFECSKSSDAIDNSKVEFTVSNSAESESENDHDYQMKYVEKLASCADKEGVQEELNEAKMLVADEVPLKTESIAVHDLFTENEHTSDLPKSIFSNCAVQAETSANADTYSMPNHSPGFECSKSSDAIDNSKAEFTVSNSVESESENDDGCQMKHVKKVASSANKEEVQQELNEDMMLVADEVPLKTESIAAHDLLTENEHTSDLPNSTFSNCAVQAETSVNTETYLMPDHSPGFECSKSSAAIDNSKAEFTVSNAKESESENDDDCQMKHVKKVASSADKEEVQEELNEATMRVADEVPLKTESIAAHDLFTENEHTSDLPNSIFSNCAVQAATPVNAETYSMPDHSPGFDSKSSDAIDNLKAEFTVSNSVESESENDDRCQMKHVKKVASSADKEEVHEELNEATMRVADEVPLKTESIAAHDLLAGNEHASDLPGPLFSNCAVQTKTSENAETYWMPDHSPGFEGSKSSDTIDNSKADFTVSDAKKSESENDLDCQMKYEVEKLASCVEKEGVQEELNKAMMYVADEVPLKSESIAAHDLFTENEHTSDLLNSIFSNCAVQAEALDNAVTYCEPDHSPGFEGLKSSDSIHNSKAEFIVSNPLSKTFNQDQLLSDNTTNAYCNSQVSLDKTTSFPPVSLWTNGGLLGLEPSKPPDLVVLGNSSRTSVANEVSVVCPENHASIINDNCETGKAENLSTGRDLSSHNSTSRRGCQDVEVGKTRDPHHVDESYPFYVGGVNEKGATPQNQWQLDADVETSSIEACPENDGNSFQIFPFGNRFFVNNFHRRLPSVTEVRLEPDSSLRKVALEQKGRHVNAPQTTYWKALNGVFGQEPSVESLTSSPPLEHMKISFRPLDGFESSKLQLKLPDGKSHNGSVRDMFLSFHLVPEPSASLQVSDSEEDTFCRSSPYTSDESPSPHSESDSELWESGESLDHTDHLLYDETLGRISSVDLGSGCLDPEDISRNCLQHEPEYKNVCTENDANPPPSFNAVNSVPHEETENKSKTIRSQYLKVTSPMPPPLPPAQWGIMNPPSAVENDQQHETSEAGGQASDTKPLECIVHHHPKQGLNDGQVNGEATAINANDKEQENLSLQSEANNAANGEIDRNKDFLHQIRTKPFMLKPTTTAKTSFTPDGTENDKFATRLLRKASSIPQAVGSDDGQDSWSDT